MDLALGLQSLTTSTVSIPNMGLMVRKGQVQTGEDWRLFFLLFFVSNCISISISLCISLKKYPILGEEGPSELGGGGEAVEPVQFLPLPHRLPG